jgi:hypothetical protein
MTFVLFGLDLQPVGRHEASVPSGLWPYVVRWRDRVFVALDEPTPMGWIRYEEHPEYRIDDHALREAPRAAAPPPPAPPVDEVCEHGVAMDVHCCNCHTGFIFDVTHECPDEGQS